MKQILTLIIFLLLPLFSVSQQSKIDSLKLLIINTENDSIKYLNYRLIEDVFTKQEKADSVLIYAKK